MHSDTGEDKSGNDGKGSDSDGKGSDSDGERSDSDDEGTFKMFRSQGTASPDLQRVQELQANDGTWERFLSIERTLKISSSLGNFKGFISVIIAIRSDSRDNFINPG